MLQDGQYDILCSARLSPIERPLLADKSICFQRQSSPSLDSKIMHM